MLISDFVTSLYFSFFTTVSMLFIVWMPLAAVLNELHKTGFAMINILELKVLSNKFVVYWLSSNEFQFPEFLTFVLFISL